MRRRPVLRAARRAGRRAALRTVAPVGIPGGPRCVLVRNPDGRVMAVDEYGRQAEIVGAEDELDMMGQEAYEDDDMGVFYGAGPLEGIDSEYEDDADVLYDGDDEDDDEDEDEQVMGEAEDAAAELENAAETQPEEQFGQAERRLDRRIERITSRIDAIKARPLRAPFRRRKARKRQRRVEKLKNRRRELQSRKRQTLQRRRQVVASIAGTAAGIGAAQGLGQALMSRQGVNEPLIQEASRLYDPQFAHRVRTGQARAGSRAQYVAPPGSGRLNRVPMFALDNPQNPRNSLEVPVQDGVTAGLDLFTEDLPYVLVKLVGFVASTFGSETENNAIGLVEGLRIRGGTNLFLHDGPANAEDYNTSDEQLRGLRSYPNIRSPNQAQVTVKATGDLSDIIIITTAIVVDILEDDTYGAGFSGPYAG